MKKMSLFAKTGMVALSSVFVSNAMATALVSLSPGGSFSVSGYTVTCGGSAIETPAPTRVYICECRDTGSTADTRTTIRVEVSSINDIETQSRLVCAKHFYGNNTAMYGFVAAGNCRRR